MRRLFLHAAIVLAATLSVSATFVSAQEHDLVIGPEYRLDPDLTDKGIRRVKRFEFTMQLADSKIFPGTDSTLDPKKKVNKERKIFVYVPAAYQDGTEAPILVMHDGPSNLELVSRALDNLTISKDANRKLPAFVAISVQNGGNDGKGSQRGLEYDTMSDRLARFINDEVLPAVLNNSKSKRLTLSWPFRKTRGSAELWAVAQAVQRLCRWVGSVPTCSDA